MSKPGGRRGEIGRGTRAHTLTHTPLPPSHCWRHLTETQVQSSERCSFQRGGQEAERERDDGNPESQA